RVLRRAHGCQGSRHPGRARSALAGRWEEGEREEEAPPANAPPAPSTQPCPRPAVLRPAGARPAGARPLAGASPCLRRTRDLPLEAEAAARSSRGNIDGPNNPTKHGRELLGGHMPHANPTPTPQDF
ncbi:unnamed protein product, partial [Prorocentrum cordatum]